MAVVCSRCDFSNEVNEKFCGGCGVELIAQAPRASPAARSPQSYTPAHLAERVLNSRAALEGERKQVTVLFADIQGSTALIEGLDPEQALNRLQPAVDAMMQAVHRYEGIVNRVQGDGIMALFGAPLAHEDHAVRASYAALDMQQTVTSSDDGLSIRVGFNSGEVVVRTIRNDLTMEYEADGPTVHLAARMEQAAAPGSICLTAGTRKLVEGFVDLRPLGPMVVKGLTEPVETFELMGRTAVRTSWEVRELRGLSTFVGREAEMSTLTRALQRAGEGRGQVVAMVGGPGMGKSRLTHEFIHSAQARGWAALKISAAPHDKNAAYLPVIQLLRTLLELPELDSPTDLDASMSYKFEVLELVLRAFLPALYSLLDLPVEDPAWQRLDPRHRRYQIIEAIKALILRQAGEESCLLVFEDLHWIDTETQGVLDALVATLGAAHLLLLVTYRPEYQHDWASRSYFTQIHVEPLEADFAERFLALLIGDMSDLKRLLIERTEGTPLFMEETVRALVEGGVLEGERGHYRLTRDIGDIEIPATVQATLAERIDRLPPESKELLQMASVIGQELPIALLRCIVEVPEDEMERQLAELQGSEFLYQSRMLPEPVYVFNHALTHDVAYDSLLKSRRRKLHARVGEAIEKIYAGRLLEFIETLADHYEKGERWNKAVVYQLRAAEKAKEQFAYTRALQFCQRVLACAERLRESDDDVRRALVLCGDLWSLIGEREQANDYYDRALCMAGNLASRLRIENRIHHQRFVVRDGGRIAYYEHGSGDETIVFIIPLLFSLAQFQPTVERLCQDFRLVTIDPRGTGASDRLTEGYSFDEQVEDVRAVIEDLGTGPVSIVGQSRGAAMQVRLSTAYPQLVTKNIIIGITGGQAGYAKWVSNFLPDLERGDNQRVARVLSERAFSEPEMQDLVGTIEKMMLALPGGTLRNFFLSLPTIDAETLAGEIQAPTLVVHGTKDCNVPFEYGEAIASRIPGAVFYPFVGRGHLPNCTAPGEFCEVLIQFLRTGTVPSVDMNRTHPDP